MAKTQQKPKTAKSKNKKSPKDSTPVMDVVCPQCKGRYHETTEHFDPVRLPNTSMAWLKEPYRSWGWEDFNTPPPGDGPGHMNCPNCGAAYVSPKMGLIVRPQKKGDKQDGRTEEE